MGGALSEPGMVAGRHRVTGLATLGDSRRAAGVVCDIQAPRPYELTFANDTDVICLLFGSIDADTAYDGGRARRMRFEPMTIAWHPAGGHVAVAATRVSAGFAAMPYGRRFADTLLGDDAPQAPPGTLANIASPTIAHLVGYARSLLCGPAREDALALEMLASLAYLEALRGLRLPQARREHRPLGVRDMARTLDLIESEIASDLSYAEIARAVGVPVTTLARAFRRATGKSVHRYVLERRIERVRAMLGTPAALADIAQACGFSSQAHMTTMFARQVGSTPARYRAAVAPKSVRREN